MDEEYDRNVEQVMEYLVSKARSKWVVQSHKECFSRLASYLDVNQLTYSDETARKWLLSIANDLSKTSHSIYAGALSKLDDAYAGDAIKPFHYRAPKREDRLCNSHRQTLDNYCTHLQSKALAQATVENHRSVTVRLLLDMQEHGVESIQDATYTDLIRVLLDCEGLTYYAKTSSRGVIRSFLDYLYSVGLVRFGFTLLVDAMATKKGYCWMSVDQKTLSALRDNQAKGSGAIPLERYLELVEDLVEEHRNSDYSESSLRSISRFGNLLYLFMDINDLLFDSDVGLRWAESMKPSLTNSEFKRCRRIVMLLGQSFRGIAHDLSRPFTSKETLRKRLQTWCTKQVDDFLAMKRAEGWKSSTLTMFETCVCRFCLFLDDIGIKNFSDVTTEHIKRFNVEDRHETPEGKNAFNSRIRCFLEWLGDKGMLSNPYLFLALPNVAALRETVVVALTSDEQGELQEVLDKKSDTISLRDRAMLELGLHMGIRASDVVGLIEEDIDWTDASVRIVQRKTGYEVRLPMPTDVANALFRYIVAERPRSCEQSVFLRCRAPHVALGAETAQNSLRKALPHRHIYKSGFHALRKTFATNMLRAGASSQEVAEALGHQSTDNVHKYLSLDEERMRLCAISLDEANLAMEGGIWR